MDTEIVDYTSETYSLGAFAQPHISNSILSMDSRPLSSEHSIQEIGLNAYSFHQTFSPSWAISGSMCDSSSTDASQSDSSQSYLRVAKGKIDELTRANLILQTRLETLESVLRSIAPSYGSLTQACSPAPPAAPLVSSSSLPDSPFLNPTWPTSSSSSGSLLIREHYPNVKYWYRQDWLAHVKQRGNSANVTEIIRGKTLTSQGINKTILYLEDIEGKAIDGYRLRDIRAHARAIWTYFQSIGRLPTTWGRADPEIAGVYRRKMRSRFVEFGLCDNDWKADLLATESYPSWYNNHVKGNAVKGNSMANFKRPLTMEPSGAPSKKAKVQNLLTKKFGSILTNSSIGNTGLLGLITIANSSISVALAPEPMSTTSDTNSPLVVTQIDDDKIGLTNDSNNAPGAEDGQVIAFSQTPALPPATHMSLKSSMILTVPSEACTQLPSLPTAVATTTPITLEPVSCTIAGTAPAPRPIFCSATAASGPSLVGSEEVQASDFVETAATVVQPTLLSTIMVSQPSLVSPTLTTTAVTMTSMPSSQILQPVPPTSSTSGPPASTKRQKANQAGVAKKVAKMRPNSTSLTPRNLCAHDWCAQHPDGTVVEFKQYYDCEISDENKKMYEQLSKEAKESKAKRSKI